MYEGEVVDLRVEEVDNPLGGYGTVPGQPPSVAQFAQNTSGLYMLQTEVQGTGNWGANISIADNPAAWTAGNVGSIRSAIMSATAALARPCARTISRSSPSHPVAPPEASRIMQNGMRSPSPIQEIGEDVGEQRG